MSESTVLDEAACVWAAALAVGVDPVQLSATVDVAALAVVVADADVAADPVDAAARLLVGMVRRRPFPAPNASIGWLTSVDWLARRQLRVVADPPAVVELCGSIRAGSAEPAEVAAAMRAWVIADGIACPVCGRRVYARDPLARRSLAPVGGRFELTARCAFEHRTHDKSGRPMASPTTRPVEGSQPILATGECGSFLVAGEAGSVAVSPLLDDPPIVRVVEIDDLRPGDLVGRWDSLIERSTTLGFVSADEAAPDELGRIDLTRLHRALRAGGRSGVGAAGKDAAHHRVGTT